MGGAIIDPTVLVALIGFAGVALAAYIARMQATVKKETVAAKELASETKAAVVELTVTYDGNMTKLLEALKETAVLREEAGQLRGRAEGEAAVRMENARTMELAAAAQAGADKAVVAAAQAVTLASAATELADTTNGYATTPKPAPGTDAAAVVEAVDSLVSDIRGDVQDTHTKVTDIHEATVEHDPPA